MNSQVMKRATDFHNKITAALKQANNIFDYTASFYTAVDMLNSYPDLWYLFVTHFLFSCQFSAFWFLLRHKNADIIKCEALKTGILQKAALRRKFIRCRVCKFFVMPFTFNCLTEKYNRTAFVYKEKIFYSMTFFLTAIEEFLFVRLFRTLDASFGSIMAKRGESADDSWAVFISETFEDVVAPSASFIISFSLSARAFTVLHGACPIALNPFCRIGRSRWSHIFTLDCPIPNNLPWRTCKGLFLR